MRLLVVEDESLLAQQIKEQLQQQQFSVDVATDGDDGWFKLSEYPYDLAIIDIGLPKMDGLALIRKARQQDIKTPVIVLTARGSWQENRWRRNQGQTTIFKVGNRGLSLIVRYPCNPRIDDRSLYLSPGWINRA
mgnify:CR=1 FL=1